MNKKFLIILIIAVIIVLVAGALVYRYFNELKTGTPAEIPLEQKKDSGSEKTNENTEAPQVQIQAEGTNIEGTNGGGGLTICSDKCGDGVCQKTDPNCKTGSLNCICPETPQDCPQDCK